MKYVPWLPQELRPYRRAKLLLGLVVSPNMKMTATNYSGLYWGKVYDLVRKAKEHEYNPNDFLETHLSSGWGQRMFLLDEDDLDAIAENMFLDESGWQRAFRLMSEYLRGDLNLEQLIETLHLGEKEGLVSDDEFMAELEEMTLEDFLEMCPYY